MEICKLYLPSLLQFEIAWFFFTEMLNILMTKVSILLYRIAMRGMTDSNQFPA